MEGVVLRQQDDGNCLTTLDTPRVAKRRSLTSNDRRRPFPSAALPPVSSTPHYRASNGKANGISLGMRYRSNIALISYYNDIAKLANNSDSARCEDRPSGRVPCRKRGLEVQGTIGDEGTSYKTPQKSARYPGGAWRTCQENGLWVADGREKLGTCQNNGSWVAGPHEIEATCHKNARKVAGPPTSPEIWQVGRRAGWRKKCRDYLISRSLLRPVVGSQTSVLARAAEYSGRSRSRGSERTR